MKNSIFKRSVCFAFSLIFILSSFCLPASVGLPLAPPVTASAASATPGKVTGLKAKSGVTAISLSWKKVSGADGYNVCYYDTAKKKYVSVTHVTKTEATVKKLTSATAYRFAVRAYKKSGSKKLYGPFSAQTVTATKPQKVTGLKAARTYNTVTLRWDGQKGVTGYIVYRYDPAKKKYTTVCKTKENTAVIKNLKSGASYYYAVKAYFKSNKVNYYSSLSSKLKVQTLTNRNKITKYHQIVNGGTFSVDTVAKDCSDGSVIPMTVAVKGKDVAIKSSVEGIKVRMIYQSANDKTYMVIDGMFQYTQITDKEMTQTMNAEEMKSTYAPAVYGSIKTGTKKIGSKQYSYEAFKTLDGQNFTCYYSGSELARMDVVSDGQKLEMTVNKFTASADSSLFRIPKYYTYFNLSWLGI